MKLGIKTISGIATFAFGVFASPDVLAIIGPKVATIVQTVGAGLAVFGLRHAQSKTELAARALADQVAQTLRDVRSDPHH